MSSSNIIQLAAFELEHLEVSFPVLEGPEEDRDGNMEVDFELLENDEDESSFLLRVMLRGTGEVLHGERKSPDFHVRSLGVFEVPEGLDYDTKRRMVVINGGMILYGMIRGHLAGLAGVMPRGKLLLPTINWQDVVKQKAKTLGETSKGKKKSGSKADPSKPSAGSRTKKTPAKKIPKKTRKQTP